MTEKIIQLKAELFDLQVKYGQIRKEMEDKLAELNALLKDDKRENPGQK